MRIPFSVRARRGAATAFAAVLAAAVAGAGAAVIDTPRSSVAFELRQSEVALSGAFTRFSGLIEVDPTRPDASRVAITIDPASVDVGGADTEAMLRGKDFFDVASFPSARFESTAVRALGGDRFEARGVLTLKGRAANLIVPFAVHPDGAGRWFEGSVPISRLAFGIGQGQWSDTSTLDDQVEVRFKLYVPQPAR